MVRHVLLICGAGLSAAGIALFAHRLPPGAAVATALPAPQPELVGPGVISTGLDELDAAFTPDGDTLYYAISSPGPAADQVGVIVRAARQSGSWRPPQLASFSGHTATTIHS
jgi:hypothetical protein